VNLDFSRGCDISWRHHSVPSATDKSGDQKPTSSICRRRFTTLICSVVFLSLGVSAYAHSRLVRSEPPSRAVLDVAPKELKLWFNEPIEPAFAKLWLVPASGDKVALQNHGDPSDPRLLIGLLPDNLPNGPVAIAYHVLSVDGHVVESQLSFTVNGSKGSAKE
jgi:copper resistance protein C